MTTITWHSAISERCKHLTGLGKLPPPLARDPGLRAIAVVSLMADADIHHALTPASTAPQLIIPAYAGSDALAVDLLTQLTQAVAAPCRGSPRSQAGFSPSDWLAGFGLDALVLRAVERRIDDTGRRALLAHAARQSQKLIARLQHLAEQHADEIITRDVPALLPELRYWPRCAASTLGWILAHEHDGDATRATRVTRRLQAFELYACLIDRLCEAAITAVIDEGQELVPELERRLALTRPQLGALRGAAPATAMPDFNTANFESAVRCLQAHAVPLDQRPGGGRPTQPDAWQASSWLDHRDLTLIRADYYGADETVRDAVNSFEEDLLNPLMEELTVHKLQDVKFLTRSADFSPATLAPIQSFLACIRLALVGPRGARAFEKAARLWHRRAAAVAALRNEDQAERPGWPPLCPPWTSPCGTFQIVPLTSAQMLVEEGNAHQHCVGTYYNACRSGTTQILSLRVRGIPAVTAEILLDRQVSSLRVGQFKGLCDQVPDDPVLHQAMRNFLCDIRNGRHPLNRQELRAYCRWAEDHVYAWIHHRPSLEHARRAFPLYLPLLPRGTPADFDRWCEVTGLRTGLAAALRDLSEAMRSRSGTS